MRSLLLAFVLAACGNHASQPAPAPAPAARTAPHGTIHTDVTKLGLSPPAASRAIDLARHVRGTIKPAPMAQIAEGTVVFVIAKRADGDGKASGPPLAVRRMTWTGREMPFLLSDANAMIAGTQLAGDVIVTAHYDLDGDALTKQPGDLVAQARVSVPADDVTLTLAPIEH